MKKTLAIIALLIGLASCQEAPVEWVDLADYGDLDPMTSFIPYGAGVENNLDEQTLSACPLPGDEEATSRTTSVPVLTLIKRMLSTINHTKVRSYNGTYYSLDQYGERVKLSGRIILPSDGKVSRIMVASHFTIGRYDEAPTMSMPLECLFAARGIAVIAPDYIGYGVTSEFIHPYLVEQLTAKNVVDMYFSALPFLKHIGCMPEHDDIFLFGYSQGGATTLSVQNHFETNYPDVKIRLNMAGSGPYDIAKTYDVLIARDETSFPCAIPMIIQGLDVGCHLNLDYNHFFFPFVIDNIDLWINSKQFSMGQITRMMGTKKISDVLTPEARNKLADGTIELYKCMLENSIAYRFYPKYPVYLFHSFEDDVVPFENAEVLRSRLAMVGGNCNITYNFGNYGNHTMGFLRFLTATMTLLDEHGDI